MQTKADSALEATTNVAVGFLVAWLTTVFLIAPVFEYDIGWSEGLAMTTIFAIISWVRSFVLRRFFSRRKFFNVGS